MEASLINGTALRKLDEYKMDLIIASGRYRPTLARYRETYLEKRNRSFG